MNKITKTIQVPKTIFNTDMIHEGDECLWLYNIGWNGYGNDDKTYNVAECKVEYVCDEYIILNDIDNLYSARRIEVEDVKEGYYELEFNKSKFEEIINNAVLFE